MANSPAPTNTTTRLLSLDALRGFDMFWILGGDSLAQSLHKVSDAPWITAFAEQLDHVAWEGFHFYDLIFPLFVFLMGVSSVFSLQSKQQQGGGQAYWRLFRRATLLYLLGLFYYGGLSRGDGPEMFRYVGVLQRIAICYLATGLVVLHGGWRTIASTTVALLVLYWGLLTFVPVPGEVDPSGRYAEGTNLANYIDQHYLPGYKWDGEGRWDPEGLLSTLPAIASGLLGALAGIILRRPDLQPPRRLLWLVGLGLGCLVLGYGWSLQFPIIKKLWTSSFVLVAGGWSYLLLAFFYGIIDVANWKAWSRPFVWIGMNSITIYLLSHLVSFSDLIGRVLHRETLAMLTPYNDLVVTLLGLGMVFGICYWLHKQRIYLRV